MAQQDIRIVVEFTPEDRTWMRVNKVDVPRFWRGHDVAAAAGDVLRLGGRQFVIQARVWEHDGASAILRLYVSSGHAQSDTVFG